jgi:thiamine pyrophosphate-dependent acetolactate synthase large subunit-like protein
MVKSVAPGAKIRAHRSGGSRWGTAAEEQDPLLYVPCGVGRSDCTQRSAAERTSAPMTTEHPDKGLSPSSESTALKQSACVGTGALRQGDQITAVTCPEGWGINRVRRYRAGWLIASD